MALNPNTEPGVLYDEVLDQSRRPVFLLDFTWAGRTFRVATEPITLTTADGTISYRSGLTSPEYRSALDDGIGQSFSVEVVIPVDVALWRRRGHDLADAAASLSLVTGKEFPPFMSVDQNWEDRIRVMSGDVVDSAYGDPEQPEGWLSFVARQRTFDDWARLVESDARVDEQTWASAPVNSIGKVYPIVVGAPGPYQKISRGALDEVGATPAYVVLDNAIDTITLLIAGHPVEAATVTVFDESETATGTHESFNVAHELDGLGNLVATVNIFGAGTIDNTDTRFWVAWNGGGGKSNPFAKGTLRGAGDVILWALALTALEVDHKVWAVVAPFLNRIKIDTYINDADATPWDWLADHVLPLFPNLAIVQGHQGLMPILLDPDVQTGQAIREVTLGRDWARVGPVVQRGSKRDVRTEWWIEFGKDHRVGTYTRRRVLKAPIDIEDDEQITSLHASVARRRYTDRPQSDPPLIWTETSDVIYDETSAEQLLYLQSRFGGFLFEDANYEADMVYGTINVGDMIAITDSEIHAVGRMARVTGKEWLGMSWLFQVQFQEDPIRDRKSA